MIERRGGDEGAAHLQPAARRDGFHQRDGALCDRFRQWYKRGRTPLQHLFHCDEFGLISYALQHFEIARCSERERAEFI